MKSLKVFGMNIDGTNRAIVAAHTKKDAAAAIGVTVSRLNRYGGETGNQKEIEVATNSPGTVFTKPIRVFDAEYVAR